jgi:hypothetical protein
MFLPRQFRHYILHLRQSGQNVKQRLYTTPRIVLQKMGVELPQWKYAIEYYESIAAVQSDIEDFDSNPPSAWKRRLQDFYGERGYCRDYGRTPEDEQ